MERSAGRRWARIKTLSKKTRAKRGFGEEKKKKKKEGEGIGMQCACALLYMR